MFDPAVRDYAIRLTMVVADVLADGKVPPAHVDVATPFPPSLGPHERFWASGYFRLQEFGAIGDGSYETNTFIAGGTGVLGVMALVGTASFSAIRNHNAMQQARWAATPQWHDVDAGTMSVTVHGLYLQTANGLCPMAWGTFSSAELVGPGALQVSARTANGSVSWLLLSEFAELAFVAWANACHPRHPQLVSRGWLPAEWWPRPAAGAAPAALPAPPALEA